jgi:hypothetical protein
VADFAGSPLYGSPAWPFTFTGGLPYLDEPIDTVPGREVLDVAFSPFTGGRLELAGIAQASTRAIDAGFTYEPKHSDPAAADDGLNPDLFALSSSGAPLPLVQYIEHVGPGVLRLFFDADLPVGVIVTLVVSAALEAEDPTVATGPILTASLALATYGASTQTTTERRIAARRDLRNPQATNGGSDVPGTLQIDARGDYANEDGTSYFRKRILRRATTTSGGFALLPGYGFAPRIKGLIRPGDLVALRRQIERQVLEEPDAISARATVTVIGPGVVRARISATHSSGVVVEGETTIEIGA